MTVVNCTPAVLICSSDGRGDILDRVLPSILKFWPDCPYPLFIGMNSPRDFGPRLTTLVAPPSEWRTECLEQLDQIAHEHVIVVLDDFLFQSPVNQRLLDSLVARCIAADLGYLRLLPLGTSIFERLVGLVRKPDVAVMQPIRSGRPFYSGLQIAVWNKAHFRSLLASPGSIWEFEHRSIQGVEHHVITVAPPIKYTHLVEKGRWLPYAAALLREAGLPDDLGGRLTWPKWMYLRLLLDKMRFHVVGFANH